MADRDRCELLCLDRPKAEALPSPESLELGASPFESPTDSTRVAA